MTSASEGVKPEAGAPLLELVELVAQVVRELTLTVPTPTGAPFFGLDMHPRDPLVIDAFCRQGIFRKYERALILGCGLGGAARWWALRFGCRAVGVERRTDVARAATFLSRRAGLGGRTQFLPAAPAALPFRAERFTHAWIARDVAVGGDPSPVLREVFRVLRPGGGLTAQCALDVTGAQRETIARLTDMGFVNIETQQLPAVDPPHAFFTALARLRAFLASQPAPPHAARLRAQVDDIETAARRQVRAAQIFAVRPS